MKIPFSKDQIIDRIRFENPWWQMNNIDTHYLEMRKREYFDIFFELVIERSIKRAVVLMGPRRVGKTVLLFHSIQELIKRDVSPSKICYFSVETPIYNGIGLEELLKMFLEVSGYDAKQELFIFFDEIQYLKNWEVHLKSLVDSYHSIKFIVSGSAAAALKLKSNESGAGRFTDFLLPPLTFHEYLSLKNIDDIIIPKELANGLYEYETRDIDLLNRYFIDYINFGGYPEVSLSPSIQADPGRYIRNDIIDKVLLRDLPILYGIEDIQELNTLFTYIAYNSGNEMSLDAISKSSGVAKNTIKKYITYLEAAFLIKVVHRIDHNSKVFKRANFFKIYLTNPSLRCALFSPLKEADPFIGNLVETAIYSQWQHSTQHLYYARWSNGEIDIVSLNEVTQKPNWIVEVKWTNKLAEDFRELKNIKSFSQQHDISNPRVTTYNISKNELVDGVSYRFTPASLYCYMVGRNILRIKVFVH
ncbi:MAG TPA: ATP-binding protein [Puia sp.]|nr:ATP-binding protein [Puia sp.]